ncbi:hypothetical protein SD80_016395 [Scytonema tolypothrichoides VB-61278]|nr:hypothetical protein SD80_016395 [Scytonema tolypothrichoides VB-61278]
MSPIQRRGRGCGCVGGGDRRRGKGSRGAGEQGSRGAEEQGSRGVGRREKVLWALNVALP